MDSKDIKTKISIDKNILDLFWPLCDKDANIRIKACADLLHVVWKKQQEVGNENELCKDLHYCIERLIKGLASPRDAARLGYALLLTEILKRINTVQMEEVLELLNKHLIIAGKQDKVRDSVFGQLFAYTAIVRSGRILNHIYLAPVILSLYELCQGKNYMLNATYEVLLDCFSQLTSENFKDVWSQLKKELPSDWESCSSDSLWLLFLCLRLFPDIVSKKYMKNHWGAEDIFASENLNHLKRIIKQTTSCLPNVHPLCTEFLLLVKQRKDFKEIWDSVVDDNLFDHEQSEKSFIGFEMIKLALQDVPSKKILKIVLSSKFQTMFSRSYLNARHPMNRAACQLADFLCNFVKNSSVPDIQIIVLKAFLQPPRTMLFDQILRKKEVLSIIQSLLPDAVKTFCDILKSALLKKKSVDEDKEGNSMKPYQALHQISNLVAHPVTLTDTEWRMDVIRFLFLHSFFTLKESSSEIPHCENVFEPLSDTVRDYCRNEFFRAVNSLHIRSEKSTLNNFLEQLLSLTGYAEQLMNASDIVEPEFSIEKIQESWNHLKSIVHKLSKQSKKDGLVNESNAFQALFLQLGLHLFQDPDHIPEVLEELYVCCKKSLKSRKHDADNEEDTESDPPWIGVVVDIFLSFLSESSKSLRSLVTHVFPLFCPFMDSNALQQILDVINPQKEDEDMLVEESDGDDEEDKDVDFESGSSSDESDKEADNQPVDEQLKKKLQEALGPAAEDSDAESVVLSDSEMFKLDNAISEAFKGRLKSGHTQMRSEEKTLLDFRLRCFDLIMLYLRSEPPMHLVLMCIEPVLAAFEIGHKKHQTPLLNKAVTVLKFIIRIRKFQHHNDVSKSELKRLLDVLIPKCHKEIDMSVSKKLSSLCVFIVLCYRKLQNIDSPDKKKSSKTPSYIKTYLLALETFVSSGSSHMLPLFFTHLMEACPDLAWHFIEPCKNYAFNSNTRLFKRTQCLGLMSESLKYSKSQKDISDDQWLEFAHSILSPAIETLKNALENSDIKPVYSTELLNIIYTLHSIINEKTGQSVLGNHTELLALLTENTDNGKMRKLNSRGRTLKNRIIICLGGSVSKSKKSQAANEGEDAPKQPNKKNKRKSIEMEDTTDCLNGDMSNKQKKKLKNKKRKSAAINSQESDSDNES